jgi:hypothetical protein
MPPVPPKRRVWDEARAAEAAWSMALSAHGAATPGAPGLEHRLRASAEAAREMAAVARRAQDAGLAWATLGDANGDRELDVLGGELAAPHRWLCAEWVAVESAERQAARVVRVGTLDELGNAFVALAEGFGALADVAGKPHGPAISDGPRAR